MLKFVVMNPSDNTAVALADMGIGEEVVFSSGDNSVSLSLGEPIGFGHKFALREIRAGEEVLKYGTVIGLATQLIEPGHHVHIHNVESIRARGDKE